ncbi:MAG: DUF309 domain-containing protein [Chthoniobacterales bacterium]
MNKGERISRFLRELGQEDVDLKTLPLEEHPFYHAFFHCWNERRYYEAHDVLEQLWLKTNSRDANYFKGLIQAAGAFVHLQKHFEQPAHPKHGRRLQPAVRLFQLAEKNLAPYAPVWHSLDVAALLGLLRTEREKIVQSDFRMNPWSPEHAPKLKLLPGKN